MTEETLEEELRADFDETQEEQQALDAHAWQDWPVSELTDSPELLAACWGLELVKLGPIHEAMKQGEFVGKITEGLTDAFNSFWLAYPECEQPEYQGAGPETEPAPEPPNGETTPERLKFLERRDKALGRIGRLSNKIRLQQSEWEAKKAEASALKKDWEKAVRKLQKAIDDAQSGQQALFDDPEESDQPKDSHEKPSPSPAAAPEDDYWQKTTMAALGVKGKLLERLIEAGIETLGQWTDWHGQGIQRPAIKGVGEGAVSKVADLCERFWAERNQASSADPPQEQPKRGRLTVDILGLIDQGMRAGTVHEIKNVDADGAVMLTDTGNEVLVKPEEYEVAE